MASETALWRWLSQHGEPPRPGLHMARMENAVSSARPDVEGQFGEHGHFDIELKVLHDQGNVLEKDGKPDYSEETGRLKFRAGQREWLRARWEAGGMSYILVEGNRDDLYLIPGAVAMALDQISTVKTAFLQHLSIRLPQKSRSPEHRDALFRLLGSAPVVRQAVATRLQNDPQLQEASQRIGVLAQLLGSPPDA